MTYGEWRAKTSEARSQRRDDHEANKPLLCTFEAAVSDEAWRAGREAGFQAGLIQRDTVPVEKHPLLGRLTIERGTKAIYETRFDLKGLWDITLPTALTLENGCLLHRLSIQSYWSPGP
ncbi:hypothetical protein LCGC14_1611000 [marine sediment metagenome]|uniref:Uncharacterized protein n=1 Tax=marine sediment metagenome TaxID=412755 RepID=A0A0F9IV10_9ZZZZ